MWRGIYSFIISVLLLIPLKSLASAVDVHGLSSVGVSTAGVSPKLGASFVYENPAGLGRADDLQVTLGWMSVRDRLLPVDGVVVQNGTAGKGLQTGDFITDYPNFSGLNFGVMLPLRVASIVLGTAGFLPIGSLANADMSEGLAAVYSNYYQRPRRFSWIVGGAIDVLENLSFGIAGNIYFTSAANSQININGENSTVALAMDIKPAVSPIIGLRYLLDRWSFDTVYHDAVDYRFVFQNRSDLVLLGNTGEGGEVSLPVIQFLSQSSMFYDPKKVAGGVSYRFLKGVTVGTRWIWKNWKKYRLPLSQVSFMNPGGLESSLPHLEFRDVISPGVGVEIPVFSWFLRAGYRYEPQHLVYQDENSNFLDTDTHLLSTGVGHTFRSFLGILRQPVTLDTHLQLHQLVSKKIHKSDPEAIGYRKEGYSIGGSLLNYGLTLSMTF